MVWENSDLYSWPYYAFHFSYSFSLLLLSIFIYSSWGLYNLDFKNIIVPLYVSFSSLYKINGIKEKTKKMCGISFCVSLSLPRPSEFIILCRALLHTLHVIMHVLYHWPTKLHHQSQVKLILFVVVAVASGNRGGYWTPLGYTMNTAKSICAIKYWAIGLTRTY